MFLNLICEDEVRRLTDIVAVFPVHQGPSNMNTWFSEGSHSHIWLKWKVDSNKIKAPSPSKWAVDFNDWNKDDASDANYMTAVTFKACNDCVSCRDILVME